jgi:hypothetical protein
VGWSGITISSDDAEIVKGLQGNTKMTQIRKRGAESRLHPGEAKAVSFNADVVFGGWAQEQHEALEIA